MRNLVIHVLSAITAPIIAQRPVTLLLSRITPTSRWPCHAFSRHFCLILLSTLQKIIRQPHLNLKPFRSDYNLLLQFCISSVHHNLSLWHTPWRCSIYSAPCERNILIRQKCKHISTKPLLAYLLNRDYYHNSRRLLTLHLKTLLNLPPSMSRRITKKISSLWRIWTLTSRST